MYAQLRESLAPSSGAAGATLRRGNWRVSRNVVNLGLTSLFTDISSEMISAILPLYLVFFLRLTPLEYGFVDGLYQGASALVRVVFGYAADRWQRYKEVAAIGYALSALCKPAMLVVGGSWTALAVIVLVDRTGKGMRTAPRDALISLSSPHAELGLAFGVHRALDTLGAMVGPLVAFGVLAALPNAFDVVFVASFCAALLGLCVLGLLVENRAPTHGLAQPPRVSWRAAAGLLREGHLRALTIAGVALGLATVSDGFVYLVLQRQVAFPAGFIPLLPVTTSLAYLVLAVPAGRLADRVGRARVFLAGYGLLLVVYASLLLPTAGLAELLAVLFVFGAYYAATDGVLMALASAHLAGELRTSGLAVLTTGTGLARLAGSMLFGALWTVWGVEVAAGLFLLGLLGAVAMASLALARTDHVVAA